MRSDAEQPPGRRRWTIGRLMIGVAVLGVVFAVLRQLRGAPLELVATVLLYFGAIAFGFCRGRRRGGSGVFGSVIAGWLVGMTAPLVASVAFGHGATVRLDGVVALIWFGGLFGIFLGFGVGLLLGFGASVTHLILRISFRHSETRSNPTRRFRTPEPTHSGGTSSSPPGEMPDRDRRTGTPTRQKVTRSESGEQES